MGFTTRLIYTSHPMSTSIPSLTLGIDLGDKHHAICVLDQDGTVLEQRSITNHRKSDEANVMMLARIARFAPELLCPIQHNSEQQQRDLLQIKLRDTLVRQRVTLICTVRGILKSLGIQTKSPSSPCFTRRLVETLSISHPEVIETIQPSLDVIDLLSDRIKALDKHINELADTSYPETKRLRQINGVGALTALSFVLIIEDPHRFKNSRSVGADLGLTPKRDQSGNTDKQLSISKTGDNIMHLFRNEFKKVNMSIKSANGSQHLKFHLPL